ncbi:MAG: response regulator [Acidobacteria bacterium]|nr:response regulator [Acidobacteriota bacterium]
MPVKQHLQSILLVEDDPDYSDLLRQAFIDAGFQILKADNGERALEVLRQEPVDLVVSDFIMPELNGMELCRLVHNDVRLSRVKVILYSCNPDKAFRDKARELGALDYLSKTDDILSLVRQICELAGIEIHGGPASQARERVPALLSNTRQLRVLFDNLLDFMQIGAVTDSANPTVRLAWDAAQRTSGDIKRILEEIEKLSN